jgi:type I restriction enzyme M protein
MDASEFRNYILGLIFYRFLSEKAEAEVADALADEDVTYEEAWEDDEYRERNSLASMLPRKSFAIDHKRLCNSCCC